MKILVLGGDGMLGHQLVRQWRARHEVRVTLRRPVADYASFGMFDEQRAYGGVDIRDIGRLGDAIADFKPDAVVNAVGLVKQRPDAAERVAAIEINALFPHKLSLLCAPMRIRVVQLSTDCVFSGSKGGYTEDDDPDPHDLYGRTKLLGELEGTNCITLRTSIIGLELSRKTGLLEWFLAQRGEVRGYTHAIYTGFTTIEMARIIEDVVVRLPSLQGIYHVSSEPISKYDLLRLANAHFKCGTDIVPYGDFRCDRSLNSARFRRLTGYTPPSWDRMIGELAADHQLAGRTQ